MSIPVQRGALWNVWRLHRGYICARCFVYPNEPVSPIVTFPVSRGNCDQRSGWGAGRGMRSLESSAKGAARDGRCLLNETSPGDSDGYPGSSMPAVYMIL